MKYVVPLKWLFSNQAESSNAKNIQYDMRYHIQLSSQDNRSGKSQLGSFTDSYFSDCSSQK